MESKKKRKSLKTIPEKFVADNTKQINKFLSSVAKIDKKAENKTELFDLECSKHLGYISSPARELIKSLLENSQNTK